METTSIYIIKRDNAIYHAYEHTTSHLCSFVVVICSPVQERRQTDMIMHSMHYNNTKEYSILNFPSLK